VWLVFDLVIFWTAFPHAFASVMTTLALPLWLAVAGIVLRGAGFAFRKELTTVRSQRAAGAAFAFSSVMTPFFMGTVIGAVVTGGVDAGADHASLAAWTSPTALIAGFLFVAACGYLAAVYLVTEAAARGDRHLQAYFTHRAQAAAIVAGALSLAALATLHAANPALFGRLTGRALPLVILAGVCGLAVFVLLTIGRPRGVRAIAALGVAAVVWGWGVAQYPVLLPGTSVTLGDAGAPPSTLVALIVVFIAAVLLLVPSFALLYRLQGRRVLEADDHGAHPVVVPAGLPSPPSPAQRRHSSANPPAAVIGLVVVAALVRRWHGRGKDARQ
jgi:cytochrome d ubiquinol oxidase subunit II